MHNNEHINIGKSSGSAFTWTFPIAFTHIYGAFVENCNTENAITDQGATIIASISGYTNTQIRWYIKNNSTGSSAYSQVQQVLVIGY